MTKIRELEELPLRLFAIGDIHGCTHELEVLLTYLEQKKHLGEKDQVIFIGDYIDRGKDSKGVIERLIKFQAAYPNTIFLRGNHEDMLLEFLGFEGCEGWAYLQNGGAKCLESYGFKEIGSGQEVLAQFPREHLSFLLNLERYVICGDFVFVHAGLSPLRDLRAQLDRDLFWIRDEFIANIHHFKKTIIFGHTPYRDVMFHHPYKIGIDTGLVYGNRLTCIEMIAKEVYQVRRGKSKVETSTFEAKAAAAV